MCGIYGILTLSGAQQHDRSTLRAMGDAIIHRGPDDEGAYTDSQLLLGMRRLSIIDVAGGHQPLTNEDGSVVVVCNGEIYNYRQLRQRLESQGHRFATHSDTEVIAHLYEERGEGFLTELDGMFGCAVWDRKRKRLIVARDPLGIKPIYYRLNDRELMFASEAKSLMRVPRVSLSLDQSSLAQYLAVGYVSAPNSIFKDVRKLPPGVALIAEEGRCQFKKYWELAPQIDRTTKPEEWAAQVRVEMERAVADQMVADVPIGAFLSGGIDSSAVVAFMSKHSKRPVKTYSIGFAGSSGAALYNELPYARQVATTFGTEHREILVQPDVASLLPQLLWHMDEPVADAAFITTYLVSKFARQDVTVILSGVGGDELFGGYTRYLDEHYRRVYHRIPQFIRRGLIEPIAKRLPSDRHNRVLNKLRLAKAFLLADSLPFEQRYGAFMQVFSAAERHLLMRENVAAFDDCIARAFAGTQGEDPLRRLMDVDLATQMPEDLLMLTDKMSMAVSLECRVPLLDQKLVKLASRIPGPIKMKDGRLKHVMKEALVGVLPDSILNREKRGFGAPIGAWFKSELAALVRDVLSPAVVAKRGWLDPEAVKRTIGEHERQEADRTDHLLALVNLELWCRLYLDGATTAGLTDELRASIAA